MKSRICPYRRYCHDAGECETCDFSKAFEGMSNKIKRLKAKVEKLTAENEELREKLEILTNPNF